jgi:hypothetical protein
MGWESIAAIAGTSEGNRLPEQQPNLLAVLKRITHQMAMSLDGVEHPSPAAISAVNAARAAIAEVERIGR